MTPKKKGNGRKTKKQIERERNYNEFREEVIIPLLSMFAMVDDVFTEQDAFDEVKRKIGYGRIYREWLEVREKLDPEFDKAEYRRIVKMRQDGDLRIEMPQKWHRQVRGKGKERAGETKKPPEAKRTKSKRKVPVDSKPAKSRSKTNPGRSRSGAGQRSRSSRA